MSFSNTTCGDGRPLPRRIAMLALAGGALMVACAAAPSRPAEHAAPIAAIVDPETELGSTRSRGSTDDAPRRTDVTVRAETPEGTDAIDAYPADAASP